MHRSKLFDLLRALNKDEFRRFYKFIKSPWFNANQSVIALYEYLRPFYPDFNSPKIKKEQVFQKLYPGEPYLDTRMRTLTSLLKKLTEEYIYHLEIDQEGFRKRMLMRQAYSMRKLYPFFKKETDHLLQELEENPHRDMAYFYDKMILHRDLFFHPDTRKYKNAGHHLQATVNHLDQYYLSAKFRFTLEMITRSRILEEEYQNFMIEELMEKVVDKELTVKNPVLGIYFTIIQLHEAGRDDDIFDKATVRFWRDTQIFTPTEQQIILQNLINYTIRIYNSGVIDYLDRQLELYKIGLEKGIVTHNQRITDASFTNIVVIGSMLHEFEWTEGFINQYAPFLDAKTADQAINLSWAYFYYHKKDYPQALSTLMGVTFSDVTYNFRSRAVLLRVYYESCLQDDRYYESLLAHLEAFRRYISRDQSIGNQRMEGYSNLIYYANKLAVCQFEKFGDKDLLEKLQAKIVKVNPFISKSWILEKITTALQNR